MNPTNDELQLIFLSFFPSFFFLTKIYRWDDWKETETELHWYFERNFKAHSFDLRLTTDDGTFAIVVDLPPDQLDDFDKTFQNGDLEIAMDKIHGVVIDGKKKDVRDVF